MDRQCCPVETHRGNPPRWVSTFFGGNPPRWVSTFLGGNPPLVRLQLLTMKCGGFPSPKGGNPPHEQIDDDTVG